MKKAISLFLALVVLVSVFVGLGITAYAVDTQTLWVDPVNGSDSAAGTQVAPFQTIEKAKAAAAALSAGGDVTVWLHGGTYRVSNAITFTSADSGRSGCGSQFASVLCGRRAPDPRHDGTVSHRLDAVRHKGLYVSCRYDAGSK